MIQLTLAEISEAIGGTLHFEGDSHSGDSIVTGSVETDSRLIGEGSLFFAKPGEVTDGHLFVSAAAHG